MISEKIKVYIAGKDKQQDPEAIARVSGAAAGIGVRLADNIKRQVLPYEKKVREGVMLYPSSATKCPRQLAYQVLDFPVEPMSAATKLKFLVGDLIETAVLALISAAMPVVDNNITIDIPINGKPRRGRTDGRVHDLRWKNIELKSMSSYGFKMFKEEGVTDTWGYLGQANVYMRAQLEQGLIDPPGAEIFIGIDRDSGDLYDIEVPYDEAYAKKADANFAAVESALEIKKLPNRPYELGADGTLPLLCSYCQMKYSCWAIPGQRVAFDEAGEPVYSEDTKQRVIKFMTKGRTGFRPSWKVV